MIATIELGADDRAATGGDALSRRPDDFAAARQLFVTLNVNLFLRSGEQPCGEPVRKILRAQPFPITPTMVGTTAEV